MLILLFLKYQKGLIIKILLLIFSSIYLHAQLYKPLAQSNQIFAQECKNLESPQVPRVKKFCEKYIRMYNGTVEIEQTLELKVDTITKGEAKAYLKALRKDAQLKTHILHQIEEDIISTKDASLALNLFNLESFEATIKSVKSIQNRNLSLSQSTQTKINTFLKAYHTPRSSSREPNYYPSSQTKESFRSVRNVNYTSMGRDFSNPDTIKEFPLSYLNKGFTLECTAPALYIKQNKSIYSYKNISGFSCKNNHGATSYLWNVYATGKVLKQFSKIQKKDVNFKAYARVEKRSNGEYNYIIIIDKIEDSTRFNVKYMN